MKRPPMLALAAALAAAALLAAPALAEETAADYLRRRAQEYGERAADAEREAEAARKTADDLAARARELRMKAAEFEKALHALGPTASTSPAAPETAGAEASLAEIGEAATAAEGAARAHGGNGPHGGALTALGGGVAHLEVLLDDDVGRLTVYLLDADAKTPLVAGPEALDVKLHATTSRGDRYGFPLELASEGRGVYAATSSNLKDMDAFTGRIDEVRVKGREFEDVEIRYPEGR